MRRAPKALRLHIGVFGRTNVGKSSFLNMVAGQDVAVTSPVPGTTTDVVEKAMEMLPIGPVVFLDTGGLDDTSRLAAKRIERSEKIYNRSDVVCLVTEPGIWGGFEERIVKKAKAEGLPVIGIINKADVKKPTGDFIKKVADKTDASIAVSSVDGERREGYIVEFKGLLITLLPEGFINPPPLVSDIVPPGKIALLIVPIDLQAPKGRLILPQVQTIRDALDGDSMALVVKESGYREALSLLKEKPGLVVCDSQVVVKMVAETPPEVKCTTFSILFSRYKGDLIESVRGVRAIDGIKPDDKVLIAESCSHHPIKDDIGRVKIPRWLSRYLGYKVKTDVYAGRDYPDNLKEYRMIIHCGACMTNRREMLYRINLARSQGVPMTNYGVAISFLNGVLDRTLSPFPAALEAFLGGKEKIERKM